MTPGESTERPRNQQRLVGVLLAAMIVAGVAPRLAAQRDDADRPSLDVRPHRDSPQRHKFFASLSEKEKVKLRQLYRLLKQRSTGRWPRLLERLRRLPSDKRLQAIKRARQQILNRGPSRRKYRREWREFEVALRRVEGDHRKKMVGKVPADLENKLKDVDNMEERARILRQHRRLRETRTDLIKELPKDLRDHVRSLPPRQQAQFLRNDRGYRLFKEVFSSERERKTILRGKPRQLRRILHQENLAPDQIRRPPFIEASSWQQWRALKPYQRLRILRTVLGIHRNGGARFEPAATGKRHDRVRPRHEGR